MAFVQDFEDVNSMALTVCQNLLEKYKIDPRTIGRLEVGTETLIDKSKSTKTVLMQLFSKYGNHDIEGITSINACYGGTSALFNTISWVQSEAWDGRLGLVITSDVAVYAKGPARPTGGAGAIAMLIGPDAPIVLENQRCSFLDHAYDFYKPDMNSEFPTVEGQVSITNYSKAITTCYLGLRQKLKNQRGEDFTLDNIDYACFHTPFCKQVTKGFNTLFDLDMKANALSGKNLSPEIQNLLSEHKKQPLDPKVAQKVLKAYWDAKTQASLHFSTNLGNIYTGSLYAGLVSLIAEPTINLENKRIMMFSYGSGLASSMFVLRFNTDARFIRERMQAKERLQSRTKIPCEVYDRIMEEKRIKYNKVPLKPEVQLDLLFDGTFYLESADEKYKRNYLRKTAHQPVLKANPVSSIELKEEASTGLRRIKTLRGQLTQTAAETEEVGNKLRWTGFHKKTFKERLDHVSE